MVRWCDQHQGIWLGLLQMQSRSQDCRGRVSRVWLDHDGSVIDFDVGELFLHDEPEIRIGEDKRRREGASGQSQRGGLKKRSIADQGNKLLGIALSRQRPEPRACSASHQYRNDAGHRF